MEIKEIKALAFGVSSSADIVSQSVSHVFVPKLSINFDKQKRENTVYDRRFGVIDDSTCIVCKQKQLNCNGHFGHIKLHYPVCNPLFLKQLLGHLRNFCMVCARLLVKVNPSAPCSPASILTKLTKLETCEHCNHTNPKFTIHDAQICYMYKKEARHPYSTHLMLEIVDRITDEDLALIGYAPSCHPRKMIIVNFPVVPTKVRPYVSSTLMVCDDDLTVKYVEIVKANLRIMKCIELAQPFQKEVAHLEFHIRTFIDNTQCKAKYINGRPIKSVKERISGKQGQLRNHLMGKRVNFSARTVIGPDPLQDCYTLGLPYEMCAILTKQVRVNRYNIHELQKICDAGSIYTITKKNGIRTNFNYSQWEKRGTQLFNGDVIVRNKRNIPYEGSFTLRPGDQVIRRGALLEKVEYPIRRDVILQDGDLVERHLHDGDVVLLNRQPTLHKGSMMAFRIKRLRGKTMRMNLSVTRSFNADFDGDEMNIHVPQSILAETELACLSDVSENFIRPQTNKCNISIVQDSLLGIFLMSQHQDPMDESEFQQMVMCIDGVDYFARIAAMRRTCQMYQVKFVFNARNLVSFVLPELFSITYTNSATNFDDALRIRNGVIIDGVINKKSLWSCHGSIMQQIYFNLDKRVAMDTTHRLQLIANTWLLSNGFTVGIRDCIPVSALQIRQHVDTTLINIETIQQNQKMTEPMINAELNKAKDGGNKIAKDTIAEDNAYLHTITSGSKGDWVNITQISGLLGQQNVGGQRFQYVSYDGRRSLSCFPSTFDTTSVDGIKMKYQSQGFVEHSFHDGLNPVEFFFHAASGREGITDTACKTADSGYIQRRMVKMLEDVAVQADATVRHCSGQVVQFIYGNDGMDPSRLYHNRGRKQFADVQYIANFLNLEYAREFMASTFVT
jgi:DNA-directed RNA polymerase beta' subunit